MDEEGHKAGLINPSDHRFLVGEEPVDDYEKGRQMAFYDVLSLMKELAKSFGLEEKSVGVSGIVIEDLLK